MKTMFEWLMALVTMVATTGCVVIPARYAVDKDGKTVMVEPERVVPAPIVVNTYPAYPYYPERVYYEPAPVYYGPSVVYERPIVYSSYYRPVVYRSYHAPYRVARPVRTIVIGGHGGGGHHRRHR